MRSRSTPDSEGTSTSELLAPDSLSRVLGSVYRSAQQYLLNPRACFGQLRGHPVHPLRKATQVAVERRDVHEILRPEHATGEACRRR